MAKFILLVICWIFIKILKISLFIIKSIIKIIILGWYRCLSYGNGEQLFVLMCTLAVLVINVKCSKSIGMEDIAILLCYISIMHYFSKLTVENLYSKGDMARIIMSILNRQNKANKKMDVHVREVEKKIKKLGGAKIKEAPKTIFVVQEAQKPQKEFPKNEQRQPDIKPKYPTIELGEGEYKKIECEDYENYEGGIIL